MILLFLLMLNCITYASEHIKYKTIIITRSSLESLICDSCDKQVKFIYHKKGEPAIRVCEDHNTQPIVVDKKEWGIDTEQETKDGKD